MPSSYHCTISHFIQMHNISRDSEQTTKRGRLKTALFILIKPHFLEKNKLATRGSLSTAFPSESVSVRFFVEGQLYLLLKARGFLCLLSPHHCLFLLFETGSQYTAIADPESSFLLFQLPRRAGMCFHVTYRPKQMFIFYPITLYKGV